MQNEEGLPFNGKKIVMIRTLGKGSFGKVKEAIHTMTNERLAIKILEKEKIKQGGDEIRVQREIAIIKKTNHPNVIQVYDIIETSRFFFFLMELAPNGDLSAYIQTNGKIPEIEAKRLFNQLISAVFHLHAQGISHRDIKPQNILLDCNNNLKLTDFGLGNFFNGKAYLETPCGSPCFAAPEVISGESYKPEPADLWGLGVTLFNMLCGYLPFDEPSKKELYRKISAGIYEIPNFISAPVARLIRRLLTCDPSRRITAEQVWNEEWMKGFIREPDLATSIGKLLNLTTKTLEL